MDFGESFTFPFDDQEWVKKILIGGLVMLIPFIGQFVAVGYAMEVCRRLIKGRPDLLPDWDDWGTKIVDGLVSSVIGFIWALPLMVLGGCLWLIMVPVMGFDESGDTAGVLFVLLMVCFGLIMLVYGLLLALVLPASITRYAATGEFGAAFRFGEVIGMVRDNLGVYLMVLVMTIVAQMIGGMGGIVLGCGALFTGFYAQLVMYHAYGQAYRIAVGGVESQVPMAY